MHGMGRVNITTVTSQLPEKIQIFYNDDPLDSEFTKVAKGKI